jgi:hypothetical protein
MGVANFEYSMMSDCGSEVMERSVRRRVAEEKVCGIEGDDHRGSLGMTNRPPCQISCVDLNRIDL